MSPGSQSAKACRGLLWKAHESRGIHAVGPGRAQYPRAQKACGNTPCFTTGSKRWRGVSAADPRTTLEVISAAGEMGERIRAFDWSATPLGPIASWPQSLVTAVRKMLCSRYPMFLWWGKNLTNFY